MGKAGLPLADILWDVSWSRPLQGKVRLSMSLRLQFGSGAEPRPPAVEARAYFAALAPAAAAKPSCWPVPPLAPIAPMILPFTVIGTQPSAATGCSGKVMNAVLPAAY